MNCTITGRNVKLLARTVNFFSKIGDELYLEALPTGLSLKILNPTSTAFAIANIQRSYFISFQQGANDNFEENNCKVSIKPVLRIFKSLSKINICKIWLEVARMKIVFQFRCKSNIVKTTIISLLEHDGINSLRLPKEFPNKIVGSNKIFGNILVHFHHSIDEITIDAKPQETIVSNHIENANRTSMRSTFSIDSSAFSAYELDVPTSVTFCYKEFKAMAHYADHNRMIVEMNFGKEGDPMLMRMNKDDVIHVRLIMGTMRPRLAEQNRSVQRAHRKVTDHSRKAAAPPVRPTDSERIDSCHTSYSESESQASVSNLRNAGLRENESQQINDGPFSLEDELPPRMRRSELPSKSKPRETFLEEFKDPSHSSASVLVPKRKVATVPNEPVQRKTAADSYEILLAGNTDDPNSESQDRQITPSKRRRLSVPPPPPSGTSSEGIPRPLGQQQSEDLFDRQSATPVSQTRFADRKRRQEKMRHIFQKCFEPSFDSGQAAAGNGEVYAVNSDPEDD